MSGWTLNTVFTTVEALRSLCVSRDLESSSDHCGDLVKLVLACLSVRKNLESTLHCCGGYMMLVPASVNARKCQPSNFHLCGGPAKLVHTCLAVRRDLIAVFTTVGVLKSLCRPV